MRVEKSVKITKCRFCPIESQVLLSFCIGGACGCACACKSICAHVFIPFSHDLLIKGNSAHVDLFVIVYSYHFHTMCCLFS